MGQSRVNTDSQRTPDIMMSLKIVTILIAASVLLTEARRVKKLHSADGDLAHHSRLQLHKGNINSIHHGPKYSSKHDKLAKKKAKYYKKLLGHKGEHQAANTRHDMDDITLQDLSPSPAPAPLNRKMKKEPKNFNEMMKMQSLKPSKKKMYKKLLAKEKSKLKKEHYKKKQQQKKKRVP